MPRGRIHDTARSGAYFLTFTVERWYYIFDRHERWPILAEVLEGERRQDAIRLLAFVFMLNHLHLILVAPDTARFVRRFKSLTAHRLRDSLARTEPTVLDLFRQDDGRHRFWRAGNAPKAIETEAFLEQKARYIHENPVRKQYVARPEHWFWSSANPDCPLRPDPW